MRIKETNNEVIIQHFEEIYGDEINEVNIKKEYSHLLETTGDYTHLINEADIKKEYSHLLEITGDYTYLLKNGD